MSRALHRRAREWAGLARPAWVVEVAQVRGSAPREPGARMLVAADDIVGSIGGGRLEWIAIEAARARLAGARLPEREDIALGPRLGQCCGGSVRLTYEPLAQALSHWPEPPPLWHLQLHGAGHVGAAIARALVPLDVDLDWVDERPDSFAPGPWPAHWRLLATDDAVAEVAAAPAGARYLVLTHSHELDLRLAQAILERGDFGFFGLIGSASKRARFATRLQQQGVAPAAIARITCPIGLAGIPGKAPELIAVAVCAQLLALGDKSGEA